MISDNEIHSPGLFPREMPLWTKLLCDKIVQRQIDHRHTPAKQSFDIQHWRCAQGAQVMLQDLHGSFSLRDFPGQFYDIWNLPGDNVVSKSIMPGAGLGHTYRNDFKICLQIADCAVEAAFAGLAGKMCDAPQGHCIQRAFFQKRFVDRFGFLKSFSPVRIMSGNLLRASRNSRKAHKNTASFAWRSWWLFCAGFLHNTNCGCPAGCPSSPR